MNKWDNSSHISTNNNNDCYCTTNKGLFIPNRQLSLIVSGFLFLGFTIFMTGYFLGKKKIAQEYTAQIQQEAIADQIYASLVTAPQERNQNTLSENVLHASEENNITDNLIPVAEEKQYYAQLIGFGTEKAAQAFVHKLASKGMETEIRKRTSRTAKGKVSYWYQVVTIPYKDKDELVALVNKISKEENIKGASVQIC